jgi:ABC-2 type transport system ATP-binding protein
VSVAAFTPPVPPPAPVAEEALLAARGLTRRFGKRVAVSGVDLTLLPGRVVGLLGPNGAGKSTLLSLLAGHLRPTSGRVTGEGLAEQAGLRGRIGMLPQGAPLPADETPRRLLAQLARLQHAAAPDDAVAEVLRATGLERAADTRLRALSGGESKLVAIGQAFLGAPRVVLLDEPTSALDPWGLQRLRALIRARRDAGAAVLLASHNLGEAEQLCDEVIVLRDGRVRLVAKLSTLLGASDEVRFEIGLSGRLPVDQIRATLPGVTADFDPEARVLVLGGIGRAQPADRVVATVYRLLGEAGAEVRRVISGRSLEAALTAAVTADAEREATSSDHKAVSDSREG